MHSCPWTGRIWCSSGCAFSSSPSTQPPQSSSRALPSSPPAALRSSLLSSLLPAQGAARARGLQSQESFCNAHWCSLCSFRTCRRCKVPCQAMPQGGNLYQRHKTVYASPISQPGFMLRARVHPCSSLLLFSAFGSTSFVGSVLRQIRPGAGFLLLGF